jgi:hypothetical protein
MLVGPALEETREYTGMRGTWTSTLRTNNRAVRSRAANWSRLSRVLRRVGNKTGLLGDTRNDHIGGEGAQRRKKDSVLLLWAH